MKAWFESRQRGPVEIQPGKSGQFDVVIDGKLAWSRYQTGKFPWEADLEKLHNLEALPADVFDVVCFPVKVHRASAGWTRAVAILQD